MSWLLLAYWLGALASEGTRFLQLSHEFDRVDYSILRVDLNLVAIGLYSLFLILELNVIRTKVSVHFKTVIGNYVLRHGSS